MATRHGNRRVYSVDVGHRVLSQTENCSSGVWIRRCFPEAIFLRWSQSIFTSHCNIGLCQYSLPFFLISPMKWNFSELQLLTPWYESIHEWARKSSTKWGYPTLLNAMLVLASIHKDRQILVGVSPQPCLLFRSRDKSYVCKSLQDFPSTRCALRKLLTDWRGKGWPFGSTV